MKQVKLCGYDLTYSLEGEISKLQSDKGYVQWNHTVAQGDNHRPDNSTEVIIATRETGGQAFRREPGKDNIIILKRALDWIHTGNVPQAPKQAPGDVLEGNVEKDTVDQKKTEKTEEKEQKEGTEKTSIKQRPAHLFKPGQSGNPAGRPKGTGDKQLTKLLREELNREYGVIKKPDGTTMTITYAQQIIRKMLEQAANGHAKQGENIFNRIDGKVKEEVELTIPEVRDMTPEEKAELDELLYANRQDDQN